MKNWYLAKEEFLPRVQLNIKEQRHHRGLGSASIIRFTTLYSSRLCTRLYSLQDFALLGSGCLHDV